ncbi:MAG: helix-turn-helix transcriptional regulator [Cryobacterium sp.]|jgi:DNA-binding PadR family transcriptional regulator|nr:helix-turn-helix transcriptional regulator [Cryobacterium sp.]
MNPNSTSANVSEDGDAFAADLLRGHTDTIVLGVLRGGDSYGFEIYKAIRTATGGDHEIKEATLYATYRRLERDGLVESYWGDETQGGRRKYYRITDAGRAVYQGNVAAWVATRRIIDQLLKTETPLDSPAKTLKNSSRTRNGRNNA